MKILCFVCMSVVVFISLQLPAGGCVCEKLVYFNPGVSLTGLRGWHWHHVRTLWAGHTGYEASRLPNQESHCDFKPVSLELGLRFMLIWNLRRIIEIQTVVPRWTTKAGEGQRRQKVYFQNWKGLKFLCLLERRWEMHEVTFEIL